MAEEFLGVDRPVDGQEVGSEMGDFLVVFEADNGEGGGSEAVFAGILCGGAGSGGFGGVGAIADESLLGDGMLGRWHTVALPSVDIAERSGQAGRAAGSSDRW